MNAPRVSVSAIEQALRDALAPESLQVIDESHLHAGHAGAASGGHYRVLIRSARFAGSSRIGRHRLVYDALAGLIPLGIHALAIEADAA
ncbi:BolA family protein [Sphaerotilus sulfidivorans]|jgi:BolA protein|uniref:BolA family protein n=1 Tax=Sphaerotilus sulfidivorans TaxID=639200 RepID=UPI001C7E231F|nr:BolA family protein [Sphaerotilus sulfidivorans]MCK6401050.1 BolA family transcriptional regulator [Sphaerotilus sulfidivorans]GIX51029.1 BolA family transcriptional regulator [Sphaerotilus natans]